MYLGVPGEGCHLLTMPKYLFFTDLILKTISSLTSDLKKLIYEWSNFRFPERMVPLNYVKIFVFYLIILKTVSIPASAIRKIDFSGVHLGEGSF